MAQQIKQERRSSEQPAHLGQQNDIEMCDAPLKLKKEEPGASPQIKDLIKEQDLP
jgi:hypothetical protein